VTVIGSVARTIADGVRMLPADVGALFAQTRTNVHDDIEGFVAGLKTWAQQQNAEPVFALLRKIDPILLVKDMAIVTRFTDVQEILSRDDVFHVPYAQHFAMLCEGRNFILGMEDTPQYTRDVATLRLAIRREDIPGIVAPLVTARATALVSAAGGAIDVVTELADMVPSALVAEYLGCPSMPGAHDYAAQAAAISGFLFLPSTPALEQQALADARAMRAALRATITDRKAAATQTDDVLGRLLLMQAQGFPGLSDEGILDQLFGIVVAIIPTTSGAVARALDELFRRPAMLARAQAAAREDDYATVQQFILEALRFNPIGPGVFRVANADYTVAAGTNRARTIPLGTKVLVALESAMMDGDTLDDPRAFRLDRPAWQYMHFGYGLHTCFGRYINAVQLPRILAAILKQPNLRRAAGDRGALQLAGPFPAHLHVEFDA
jgi:cytochrome P450